MKMIIQTTEHSLKLRVKAKKIILSIIQFLMLMKRAWAIIIRINFQSIKDQILTQFFILRYPEIKILLKRKSKVIQVVKNLLSLTRLFKILEKQKKGDFLNKNHSHFKKVIKFKI